MPYKKRKFSSKKGDYNRKQYKKNIKNRKSKKKGGAKVNDKTVFYFPIELGQMKIGFDHTRKDDKYVHEYNYKGSRENNIGEAITLSTNITSDTSNENENKIVIRNENMSLDPALNKGLGITSLKNFIEIEHKGLEDKSEQLECDNDFHKAFSIAFNKLQKQYKKTKKIKVADLFSDYKFTGNKRKHINELRRLLCNEKKNSERLQAEINELVFNNLKYLYETIKDKQKTVVIGGDHSIAIPCVANSINQHNDIKLIYFDAHPDINSMKGSLTKNIHGMPVAYLTGISSDRKCDYIDKKLKYENIMYIGIRDIDDEEAETIKTTDIKVIGVDKGAYDSENLELEVVKEKLKENIIYVNNRYNDIISEITGFIGDAKFHISFDVDCLDPEQLFTYKNKKPIPCTGTVVKNGLEFYRTKEIFDALLDLPNLLNIDISELNLGLCNEEYYNSSLENFRYFFAELFTKIENNEFTVTATDTAN